jgi:hypothetical protein
MDEDHATLAMLLAQVAMAKIRQNTQSRAPPMSENPGANIHGTAPTENVSSKSP